VLVRPAIAEFVGTLFDALDQLAHDVVIAERGERHI